jgi:signal transduction histidine kinase
MRMTLAFALGAFALSVTFASVTYELARTYLLRQREDAVLRQAYVNAGLVRGTLGSSQPPIQRLLTSLELPAGSHPVLFYGGSWYTVSIAFGRDTLPPALRDEVVGGTAARQRFSVRHKPELAVGIPLPQVGAAYFEVVTLDELSRTLAVLRTSLVAASLITFVGGAFLGAWGSRRVLQPVRAVAGAATQVAGGDLNARVEVGRDPDLASVATAFNRMTDALEERIERDARFASAVSHELRSPLTTLAAAVEVLSARRDELSPRAQVALDLVASEIGRFQRLVQDLLEISRIDAGVSTLAWEDVRLGEFVRHAAKTVSARPFPLDVEPDAARAVVRADKRRLERVVANLVENAENYGGGVVRMGLHRVDGAVQLAVEDAGPGVPRDERDRIFERFARGKAARRRGASDGTGLGLSLVAEHVRLHGGRVWVEDRDGGGARFVIELPAAQR